jgi:hypothetical protein
VPNLEVIEGAAIALISATGGALLQDYLVRRADRKDRQVQFVFNGFRIRRGQAYGR